MSALAIDASPVEGRQLVNKRELAFRVLSCSLPTLDKMLERYPDFPVVTRGGNGVEWEFDPVEALAFVRRQREDAARATVAQQEFFAQFSLPIDDVAPEGAAELAPAQRLAMAKARQAEQQLARETGFLVETAAVRQALQIGLAALGRSLQQMPRMLCGEFNLPDEVERAMQRRISDAQRQLVASVQTVLGRLE